MKKLILAVCLLSFTPLAMAKAPQITVVIKTIEGFGDSYDAFTFKATSGKRYMVYNAGGSNPIPGERLIQQAEKSKQKICLILDQDRTEPRMVNAVKKGACK